MKISKIESKVLDFINKHIDIIVVSVLLLMAIFLRYTLLPYESSDYTRHLHLWYSDLKSGGGLSALASYWGDYNYPYVTILALMSYTSISDLIGIKLLSIIFDFILAFVVGKFIYKITKNKTTSLIGGIVLLFIPTLLLNSSYWGQCDVIYTTFTVLSLYYLYEEKYLPSFILLGVSFAFKLQFIFILPLYIILYFNKKKFSFLNFLLIPIVNLVMCIPAILCKTKIMDVLMVYFKQTKEYNSSLVKNFPNFYTFFDGDVEKFSLIGMFLLVVIFAIILYLIISKKVKLDLESTLIIGVLSIILCTYFLPYMHERYMFAGVILAFLYSIIYKKNYLVFIGLEFISLMTYMKYFYKIMPVPYIVLSILYGVIIIYLIKYLNNKLKLINK